MTRTSLSIADSARRPLSATAGAPTRACLVVSTLLTLVGCATQAPAPVSNAMPPPGKAAATVAAAAPPATRAIPAAPATPVIAAAAPDLAHVSTDLLEPDTRVRYRDRLTAGEGTVFALDPARSEVRFFALRAGLGARFGHNHVLRATRFQGLAFVPEKSLKGGTAHLAFRLADLELDNAAVRAATGGGFGRPLTEADIAGTREHLLSEQNFQAERFPVVLANVVIEAGELPVASADLALTVHGETHHQRILLKVHQEDDSLEAAGSLVFRQSDYGVKPYAVMGGLIAVDDLVAVDFTLRGRRLAR